MEGEIIAPKGPNMGILKSYSLEETFVMFVNIYVQARHFPVLNSMIAPPLDRVHVTAVLSSIHQRRFPGTEIISASFVGKPLRPYRRCKNHRVQPSGVETKK